MKLPLRGLVAAPFTPFHRNGELAPEVIPHQARGLAVNGVAGAFVCGTTGEGASLTSDERRRVVEAWMAARPAGLRVIVHVGHSSVGEACALAQHAEQSGADAIATVAPSYFKPAGVEELVAWCARVAAAAPKLPFFYYHVPSMTNVVIPAAEFLAVARERIPTLAGVKFTFEDLKDYRAARLLGGEDYDILFGRDEILLEGLKLGGTGAVGSTYNYAAPLFHRIIAAHGAGDLDTAEREQEKARAFIDVMIRFGGLPAGKAMMRLAGIDCGPVRLPLRAIAAADERALYAALEAQRFSEFTSRPAA